MNKRFIQVLLFNKTLILLINNYQTMLISEITVLKDRHE